MQHTFEELRKQLVALGEDATEFSLIADIFPAMDEQAQTELIATMEKELEALQKIPQ